MDWIGDFTGDTAESMDATRVGPGWHLATLIACVEDQNTGKMEFSWRMDSPPFRGLYLDESYNNPALCSGSEKEMRGQQQRLNIFLARTGLAKKSDAGKVIKCDPSSAVGVSAVLQVVRDSYTDREGRQRCHNKIAYAGIYPLDHPEIPPAERVRLGLPLLEGQTLDAAAGKARGPKPLGTPPGEAVKPGEVI